MEMIHISLRRQYFQHDGRGRALLTVYCWNLGLVSLDCQWSGQSVVWTVSGLDSQWSGQSVVCTMPRCKYVSVSVTNSAVQCYTQSLFFYRTYPVDLSVPLKEGLSHNTQGISAVLSLYQLKLS